MTQRLSWTRGSVKPLTQEGICVLPHPFWDAVFKIGPYLKLASSVSQVTVMTSLLSPALREHVEHSHHVSIISTE